jgi:hypothetical protein
MMTLIFGIRVLLSQAAFFFSARLRGRATDIPVSQLSNSIGDKAETSTRRGSSSGSALAAAKPKSQVVADLMPASLSHGKNA